jgi:hypothetical protein
MPYFNIPRIAGPILHDRDEFAAPLESEVHRRTMRFVKLPELLFSNITHLNNKYCGHHENRSPDTRHVTRFGVRSARQGFANSQNGHPVSRRRFISHPQVHQHVPVNGSRTWTGFSVRG